MSLRYKIALTALIVGSGYIALAYFIQHEIVYPSFVELERQEAEEDTRRIVNTINREVEYLHYFNLDWSVWDDTYEFATDRNETFIEENLDIDSWLNSRLTLMYIFDKDGTIIWGSHIDRDSHSIIRSEPAMTAFVEANRESLLPKNEKEYLSGVLLWDDKPIMFSAQPILKTVGQGPMNGTMVIGSLIDEKFMEDIAKRVGMPVAIWAAKPDALLPADVPALEALLRGLDDFYTVEFDETLVHCYTLYNDALGKPAMLLRMDVARDITPRGLQATNFAFISTLGAGLTLLAVLWFSLRHIVVRPLIALTTRVTAVDTSDCVELKPISSRTDEIGELAKEFELMMVRLHDDLLRRQAAEEALRASEARVRAILESAPDGIVTVDSEGTIESINRAAVHMFGYPDNALIGRRIDILFPATAIRHSSDFPEMTMQVPSGEAEGVRIDGSRFPVHLTRGKVQLSEKTLELVIARDITELRMIHEQMAKREHLAMLGEMGASLAHEIKNPLAGISCAIQVLRDEMPPSDPRREVILEVLAQVDRLDVSVRDLLMFARPWSAERKQFQLGDIIRDVILITQTRPEFATVTFEFDDSVDCDVSLDPVLLNHVLVNLFNNAAQSMTAGGTISICVRCDSHHVFVVIRDSGEGIDADNLKRVFQPFFTTKARGTGLGLSVTKTMLETMGGGIALKSEVGIGTEVTVDLGPCKVTTTSVQGNNNATESASS